MMHDRPLTPEERAALSEISKGLMQRVTPDDVRRRLVQLGLITLELGGPVITPAGRVRLMREK